MYSNSDEITDLSRHTSINTIPAAERGRLAAAMPQLTESELRQLVALNATQKHMY